MSNHCFDLFFKLTFHHVTYKLGLLISAKMDVNLSEGFCLMSVQQQGSSAVPCNLGKTIQRTFVVYL